MIEEKEKIDQLKGFLKKMITRKMDKYIFIIKEIKKMLIKILFFHFKFILKRIFLKIKNNYFKNIFFKFSLLSNINYPAKLIVNYICIKLAQKIYILTVLKPLLKKIKSFKQLKGFKIKCTGRFNRRDKAVQIIKTFGIVSYTKICKKIEYFSDNVILKYSTCGIKV